MSTLGTKHPSLPTITLYAAYAPISNAWKTFEAHKCKYHIWNGAYTWLTVTVGTYVTIFGVVRFLPPIYSCLQFSLLIVVIRRFARQTLVLHSNSFFQLLSGDINILQLFLLFYECECEFFWISRTLTQSPSGTYERHYATLYISAGEKLEILQQNCNTLWKNFCWGG